MSTLGESDPPRRETGAEFLMSALGKTTREEQGGYMWGCGAVHTPTYTDPSLAVDFFQWRLLCKADGF
jgi:hypothetical protein